MTSLFSLVSTKTWTAVAICCSFIIHSGIITKKSILLRFPNTVDRMLRSPHFLFILLLKIYSPEVPLHSDRMLRTTHSPEVPLHSNRMLRSTHFLFILLLKIYSHEMPQHSWQDVTIHSLYTATKNLFSWGAPTQLTGCYEPLILLRCPNTVDRMLRSTHFLFILLLKICCPGVPQHSWQDVMIHSLSWGALTQLTGC